MKVSEAAFIRHPVFVLLIRSPAFSWHLALNTAISFTTNTNWQNYSGESAASYFIQMFGFAVHNFVSAATGMAIVIALIRGFARRKTSAIGIAGMDRLFQKNVIALSGRAIEAAGDVNVRQCRR